MNSLVTTHASILSTLLDFVTIAGMIILGLVMFAILALIISSVNYSSGKEERLKFLESEHNMKSSAETYARLSVLSRMMRLDQRSAEFKALKQTYDNLSQMHQAAWDARVKEMLDVEFPADDDTRAEIEAGIHLNRRHS